MKPPEEMIRFEEVSCGGIFERVSFRVAAGTECKIITRSDDDKHVLFDILLSLRKLDGGRVFLAGQDIYSLQGGDLLKVFKRAGIVPGSGRMISNLRVWENIVLPACYHHGTDPSQLEEKVLSFYLALGFERSGLGTYMGRSTAELTDHEIKLITILRAMLADPELIIYDSPFEGMEADMTEKLVEVIAGFQQARHGRASVLVTSREDDPGLARAGMVVRQQGKGFC